MLSKIEEDRSHNMEGRSNELDDDKGSVESTIHKFIDNKSIELLNLRINKEEKASRLYYIMSVWLKSKGYEGFSKFWYKWSKEELTHAKWAENYLMDLGVFPKFKSISDVNCEFDNLKDVLKQTLGAEEEITKECNDLAVHASEVKDYMLMTLATKYTSEQKEEINKITSILTKAKIYGCNSAAIMRLDKELREKA